MRSIRKLLDRTEYIKEQMQDGQLSLIEEELISIFVDLKELSTPADLEQAISILQNGTLLLQEKLEEFNHFLIFLKQKDQINEFFKLLPSDETLSKLISNSWQSPIQMPQLSLNFLHSSWKELVQNKTIKKARTFDDLEEIPLKNLALMDNFDDPFDMKMETFLSDIIDILPATIEELLQNSLTSEQYFEHFSYILHLLQEGSLNYNQNSKKFSIGES